MTEHYDAIVLGTGGVGSAALFHLAKRSSRVLGLDRFSGGHDRGSSHGETRVIRQAYFEHPDYVPLLLRAYQLWHELEALQQQQLFYQVGLLEVGPTNGRLMQGIRSAAIQHQLTVASISPQQMKQRFPGYRLPENCEALFEPMAGYLLVEQCVLAHLAEAKKRGAEIHCDEEIHNWKVNDAGTVIVSTNRQLYTADRLIVTGGAWAGDLLSSLKLPLRVVRKHMHWYACEQNSCYHEQQGAPTFFYETPVGMFYGFPQRNDRGLKLAEHTGGEPIDKPLEIGLAVDPVDRQLIEQFLSEHLPNVTLQPVDHTVCMYTLSPDEHFIVDTHPDHSQVAFAAGLSGHGFKFSSVLGEVLAELVWDGNPRLPIDFLRMR